MSDPVIKILVIAAFATIVVSCIAHQHYASNQVKFRRQPTQRLYPLRPKTPIITLVLTFLVLGFAGATFAALPNQGKSSKGNVTSAQLSKKSRLSLHNRMHPQASPRQTTRIDLGRKIFPNPLTGCVYHTMREKTDLCGNK